VPLHGEGSQHTLIFIFFSFFLLWASGRFGGVFSVLGGYTVPQGERVFSKRLILSLSLLIEYVPLKI
jgi:hypothetical protein